LLAAASRIGAVIAERPRRQEDALDRFGRNFGIALDWSTTRSAPRRIRTRRREAHVLAPDDRRQR
jgi:hypothetical protein